jgi:hypothetical protein
MRVRDILVVSQRKVSWVFVWRRLFYSLTLISLVFFVVALGFAIRSMWIRDGFAQQATQEMLTVTSIHSNCGSISISYSDARFLINRGGTEVKWKWWSGPALGSGPPYDYGLEPILGIAYRPLPGRGAVMLIPYWVILVILGGMPSVWVIRRWRRWRRKGNVCDVCGYDLRASTGRCPECGSGIDRGNRVANRR